MLQKADVAEVLAAEGQRGRRRRIIRLAAMAVAVLAVAALAVWAWVGSRNAGASAYATDTVSRGTITETLVATGTLEPVEQVSIASLVTGTISSVEVDYEEPVRKGQVLARIDPEALAAQLRHAVAAVDAQMANRDSAQALVTDARAALRRAQELTTGQTVSVRDVELASTALTRAEANLASVQAQLSMAEADLATARNNYGKATIVSPIDGVVLDVSAKVGQTITANSVITPLFTLAASLRALDLEVDVDEADIPRVRVGNAAEFTVESRPDKPIAGLVRQVRSGPTVSDGVTSYTAVISVANPDLALRPGMTATAQIATAQAVDVLSVSNSALRFVPVAAGPGGPLGLFGSGARVEPPPSQPHVYVLRDGQLHAVIVETGLTDGIRTAIISGDLAAGDSVVVGVKAR